MEATRKKRKVLIDEDVYLGVLPCAKMYERSFMHREVITHILASPKDCLVTGSTDGILKIWKRAETLPSSAKSHGMVLDFAKSFRAHPGPIGSLALNHDGSLLATSSPEDKSIKIFDLVSLDMVSLVKVDADKFGIAKAGCVSWIKGTGLVMACAESSAVLRWEAFDKAPKKFDLGKVVKALAYFEGILLVGFEDGTIKYYNYQLEDITNDNSHLEDAKETHLYSIKFSPNGKFFAVTASDRQLRVYRTATGKLYRKYDESLPLYSTLHSQGKLGARLEDMEFGRRMAVERELPEEAPPSDAVFDESGNFLIYSTMVGIKVLNMLTNRVSSYLGSSESPRFLHLALLPPASTKSLELAASDQQKDKLNNGGQGAILAATGFKKNRFYLFTRTEPPTDGLVERDVLNEKTGKDEQAGKGKAAVILPTQAIIRTTFGDIVIKMFPESAPLAVENFSTHSKNGYYDNLLFHRVIKGFMIQTGDPLGDGTGGESIWNRDFRDEIVPDLKHDVPFTVSMANAGPATNGSQFFITTVKCPWLDGKHTIFGRVVRGSEVVSKIEAAETDELDKPKSDIKILQIDVS